MSILLHVQHDRVEQVRILRGMLNTNQDIAYKLGISLEHVEYIVNTFIKTSSKSGG